MIESEMGANALEVRSMPDRAPAPQHSVLQRAKADELDAISQMFRSWVPAEEKIVSGHYLGSRGLFTKVNSFACVTEYRVAFLFYTRRGQTTYQDGVLSAIRTAALYQPSRIKYAIARVVGNLLPRSQLAMARTTGMLLWIHGGEKIYVFSDRKLLGRLNALYRVAIEIARDLRPTAGRAAADSMPVAAHGNPR